MKKQYFFYAIFLILGVVSGAFLNEAWQESNIPLLNKRPKEPTKIVTIIDTVYLESDKKVVRQIETTESKKDTVVELRDSVQIFNSIMDTVDVEIVRERILATIILPVDLLVSDSIQAGDIFNNVSKPFGQNISIEFWESPLGLTGYQLTKKKLKLFGFNPNEKITIKEGQNSTLIVGMSSGEISLQKTDQFKSL